MNLFLKSWENPTSLQRLEVVFEGRNHEYGAYVLRRDYEKSTARALILTCTTGVLLALTPILYDYFKPAETINLTDTERIVIIEPQILPNDEIKPPIIDPPKPTPPTSSTTSFVIPSVTDRDITDSVPTQNDLSDKTIGVITTKGDSTDIEPFIEPTTTGGNPDPNKTLLWVEEMPEFPGGEAAMISYLSKNIHYPADARERNLSGVVYISFVVTATGNLDKVTLLRGVGGGCEEEALRVINAMPRWKPGKQNGRAVPVQYNLPVSFTLK